MQPTPTRENVTPFVDELARALLELTDVVLDAETKERIITKLITQKYYSLGGNLSATIKYIGVSFHPEDGPDVTINRFDGQSMLDKTQQIVSRMISAWYRTIGETPHHPIARAAVKVLCSHLESQGWDPIPTAMHEIMVNAMVSAGLVGIHITKSDWRRANLTLLNVEGKPSVMIYGPEYLDAESDAAEAALRQVLEAW